MRRVGRMPEMPRRSPKRDDQALTFLGTGTQNTSSNRDGIQRSRFMPHTCSARSLKRSCENGIRISHVQARSSMLARASQTGSKVPSTSYSSSRGW